MVEQEGFEGGAGASVDELRDVAEGEAAIEGLWWKPGPGVGTEVELEAPELAVVVEDEGPVAGAEDEVVVLVGGVRGRGGKETTRHAEMKFEVERCSGDWRFVICY